MANTMLPVAINCINSRSISPLTAAMTNKDVLMATGKNVIMGYAVGYAAGFVMDKTGLKKPINKALKKVF